MGNIDWIIVALYAVSALGIGFFFTKKASGSVDDFFVAGRSLPWYIAGTSMVATTFSSDTPLFIAGSMREQGIYANWIWWTAAIGSVISIFFFARLWRRTGVVTEIEFISQRYEHTAAMHVLRVFKAVFDGLFINCIVMASVTLAMSKIVVVIMGVSTDPTISVPLLGLVSPSTLILYTLGIAAVFYTALSGLYGVVYTDLIQFGLAMVGAFALAIIVYVDLNSSGGIVANLQATPGYTEDTLRMIPGFGWNLETATFLILITVGWWVYAPGTGYLIQRILATRSERDAVLSLSWFTFCHYVLRSWPWIIVGVASLVYFPQLVDAEQAYPEMIHQFLPVGLKGIMVASLLAAFMSTLDTHMNWGSSYLINDIYKPYLAPSRSSKHYVTVSRICMLLLTFIALIVSTRLTGILDAYKYLAVMITGVSFVLIARWYWWRINLWSEISSIVAAFVFGNILTVLLPDRNGEDWFAIRMLANVILTMGTCILVTLWTSRKEPTAQVINFYRRLRIQGPGWEEVRRVSNIASESIDLKQTFIACIASILLLYSILFATGYLLFQQRGKAFLLSVFALICFAVVYRRLDVIGVQFQSETDDVSENFQSKGGE